MEHDQESTQATSMSRGWPPLPPNLAEMLGQMPLSSASGPAAATEATASESEPRARIHWWNLDFAPVQRPILVNGRQVPCLFRILGDADEEFLTRYMATLPLEIPDMPDPQKGLEWFWQADLDERLRRLRAQAEARALIALSLVAIDGKSFTLSFEDKIAEMLGNPRAGQASWPPRLMRQLLDTVEAVSHAPIVGVEALEQTPGFVSAPESSGASSLRAAFPDPDAPTDSSPYVSTPLSPSTRAATSATPPSSG